MPLWCRIEPHTPLPVAWGAAPFLVFQRDEGGKGLEDTGKHEQRARFRVGSSYLGWGSSAAEGVAGGRGKQGVITWDCKAYLSRPPHLQCLWSRGQVPALKQTQIPQDRSPLLRRLVCTWGLAFSCIFDGDVEVHQQPSIAQSPASEEEWSEEGKAHTRLGKEKRKRFCSWRC